MCSFVWRGRNSAVSAVGSEAAIDGGFGSHQDGSVGMGLMRVAGI